MEQIVDPVSRGGLHGSSSLTLQLVMKNAQMSLAKGVFALFPTKKVRSWARTRGRNCSPRWTSCSLSRYSSGRRRSGPGFLSSSAPLPRRGGGRGRRGGRGVFLAPPLGFRGAENCGVSAVAVLLHCRRPLLSCRRGRFSWSRLFSRPLSIHSCCTFQVSFSLSSGPCSSASWPVDSRSTENLVSLEDDVVCFRIPYSLVRQWIHAWRQSPEAWSRTAKTADSPQLQFIAGHRHLFSFRRGSSSWSRLCSRPQRFPSCCSMVDVPVMRACRVSGAAVEKAFSFPQLQLGLFLRPRIWQSLV